METQLLLFQQIKNSMAEHLSLVDEVADVLNISTDSAYRRIRAEKSMTIDELQKLCIHFNISPDKLFSINTNQVLFNSSEIDHQHFTLEDYFSFVLSNLSKFSHLENVEIISSALDIPVFHFFRLPELAAFKVFFYLKTVLLNPEYANKKFSFRDTLEPALKIGSKIIQTYERVPVIEIWNDESINGFLRQIEYSSDIDIFEDPQDAFVLCDQLDEEIDHIKLQAERGYLFSDPETTSNQNDKFKLYSSEVILGDNTILVSTDKFQVTFRLHNFMSILSTTDPAFCKSTENHLRNIISKSTLISAVSERKRIIFFNNMHLKIDKLRTKLKASL